jgi:cell division protein FtsI (penicillin-binding protein 3)
MTISYGHGISVSPVQLASGVSALVNGGIYRAPTLLKGVGAGRGGKRVITEGTSKSMRALMRLVVSRGTGKKANIQGYVVGGKTGTAEKSSLRGYSKSAKLVSFVGAFPMNAPRYLILALVDEPVGNKRTLNYATGGWIAAPIVGRIIERMGPMVGIAPDITATVTMPEIKRAKFHKPMVRAKTPLVHKVDWEKYIALAIRQHNGQRSLEEERAIVKERRSRQAVLVKEVQKPLAASIRSTLEPNIAAR